MVARDILPGYQPQFILIRYLTVPEMFVSINGLSNTQGMSCSVLQRTRQVGDG